MLEEVARPLQESEEPLMDSGNEVVYVVPVEEVAIHPMPPVVLFQPRTYPPLGAVPYSVEVASAVGIVAAEALLPSTPCASVPKAVVLPTDVTAPKRFAFVVTVAALPVMLAFNDEVAI